MSNGFKMKGPTFYGSVMRKSKHSQPGIKTTENMEAPSPNKALCPAPPSVKKKMEEPAPTKKIFKKKKKEGTKHAKITNTYKGGGSSGGYESTEFVKGGRKGDKTHKSTKYTKWNPTTESYRGENESDKPTYIKTKTRKVRGLEAFFTKRKKGDTVTKTKEISEKKYKKQLERKNRRYKTRGDYT